MPIKGQTIIRYGSPGTPVLEITGIHSQRVDEESVWDEHSGINQIGTKFTITARGLVHDYTDVSQPHADPLVGGDATDIMRHVRFLAMRSRHRFEMLVGCNSDGSGGTMFLECNPAPINDTQAPRLDHIDVNNGPKCISCDIGKVSANVYWVDFTYEIVRSPSCQDDGVNRSNNSGILSISFSVTDDISDLSMTSRTWEGQIRSATSRINPHSFRSFAVPVLQDGMRRDRMTFTASPDGLLLNFTIRDTETHVAPPPPALKWSPGFSKTITSGTGTKTYVEMTCGLEGDRFADRRLLVRLCSSIVDRHLFIDEGIQVGGRARITTILESLAVRENITNDSASVVVSVRASRTVFGKNLNTIIDLTVGNDPADFLRQNPQGQGQLPVELRRWDTRQHRGNWDLGLAGPQGDPRGSKKFPPETEGYVSVATAFSTHLQTECTNQRSVKDGIQAVPNVESAKSPPRIEKYTSEIGEIPPRAGRVSDGQLSAPYDSWQMDTKIHINQHVVPMSVARFSDSSLSTALLPSVLHIALAPPQAMMIVRASGSRVGAKPEMPLPYSFTDQRTGIVYQLLDCKDVPRSPNQTPGGDELWTESIEITYSMSRPPLPGEQILAGVTPWTMLGIQRTTIGNADFFGGNPLS